MENTRFTVGKVAVLGAGVMGAQIAAHLANARITTILFDLPSETGDSSAISRQAIAKLAKQKPTFWSHILGYISRHWDKYLLTFLFPMVQY